VPKNRLVFVSLISNPCHWSFNLVFVANSVLCLKFPARLMRLLLVTLFKCGDKTESRDGVWWLMVVDSGWWRFCWLLLLCSFSLFCDDANRHVWLPWRHPLELSTTCPLRHQCCQLHPGHWASREGLKKKKHALIGPELARIYQSF